MNAFSFARTPQIVFETGAIQNLAAHLKPLGRRVLLLTGGSSLFRSGKLDEIRSTLETDGFHVVHAAVEGEPSPEMVDTLTSTYRHHHLESVCAIGGGSVLDCGKAVSAMAPLGEPVKLFLEGVGDKKHPGLKSPFIACPTTAGTGSEATKNAVISEPGPDGFKKSLRHDCFVPDIALIDPLLALSCPPSVTASCGMDAFTQLLESHVSPKASPLTDALAFSGMVKVKDNLAAACTNRADDPAVRASLSYGALLSGITLANAGLGIVHALASTLGGLFPIAHGTICGSLVAPATRVTLKAIASRHPDHPVVRKYASVGTIISGRYDAAQKTALDLLVKELEHWKNILGIPRLSRLGIDHVHVPKIIQRTDPTRNSFPLTGDEVHEIVESAL